jgi:16S rRNA processing protein RimM
LTLVTAGRVGKPHGTDGSFWVEGASDPLDEGTEVMVGERALRVERRGGTADRPLVRLGGVDDARELRGELLLVEAELDDDEWLASELLACSVPGHGRVVRVLDGPSCSVLELEDGTLVPFVADAIRSIEARTIEVDEGFLG